MTDGQRGARIGVLGGTLDPIHVGHIDTALAALQALRLDSVTVMPSRVPPHRPHRPRASAYHRFAMAALAVAGVHGLTVSDDELRAEGPSFTAVTLERLARQGWPPSGIFFITGADAFAEIGTWYRYPDVLALANFVVISRSGVPVATLPDRLPHLRDRMRAADADRLAPHATAVFLVDALTANVSSTDIRRRLRAGRPIGGLVPGPVEAHILRHRLYVEEDAATTDHPS